MGFSFEWHFDFSRPFLWYTGPYLTWNAEQFLQTAGLLPNGCNWPNISSFASGLKPLKTILKRLIAIRHCYYQAKVLLQLQGAFVLFGCFRRASIHHNCYTGTAWTKGGVSVTAMVYCLNVKSMKHISYCKMYMYSLSSLRQAALIASSSL